MDTPSQNNQPVVNNAPSSKKNLYIIIGIIVVIIIVVLFSMRKPGDNMTTGDNNGTTYTNDQGTATIGANQYPNNWPSDVPKYPNATVQYSNISQPSNGQPSATAVVLLTADGDSLVAAYYKTQLVSNGWKIEQEMQTGAARILSASKGNKHIGISVVDNGNGQRGITIAVQTI